MLAQSAAARRRWTRRVDHAAPTERYTCERGTKLSVKLLGETAEVGVDGAAAVSLPALGEDGTTFSNGRQTLYVKQGVVSWAIGRMAAETCKPD